MPRPHEPARELDLLANLHRAYFCVRDAVHDAIGRREYGTEHVSDIAATLVTLYPSVLFDGVLRLEELRAARPELFERGPSRFQAASIGLNPEHLDASETQRQWQHFVHAARIAGDTARVHRLMNLGDRRDALLMA